jgi:hypothetical protein
MAKSTGYSVRLLLLSEEGREEEEDQSRRRSGRDLEGDGPDDSVGESSGPLSGRSTAMP